MLTVCYCMQSVIHPSCRHTLLQHECEGDINYILVANRRKSNLQSLSFFVFLFEVLLMMCAGNVLNLLCFSNKLSFCPEIFSAITAPDTSGRPLGRLSSRVCRSLAWARVRVGLNYPRATGHHQLDPHCQGTHSVIEGIDPDTLSITSTHPQ